jgi:hypothetical protein
VEVNYRRCKSAVVSNLSFPVYAGEDGSVVILNTTRNYWQQLKQTYDLTNGFWVTSVPKANTAVGEKVRSEIDVHRLICTAWNGDPIPPKIRVDHKNGDPDDNTPENLQWIDALGNAVKAIPRAELFPADFAQIIIDCRTQQAGSAVDRVAVRKLDGTIVQARGLVDRRTGRPLSRLSSILIALSRETSTPPEKDNKMIPADRIIVQDSVQPHPDRIAVRT